MTITSLRGDMKSFAVAGLVLAGSLIAAPLAVAQEAETGPASQACVDAKKSAADLKVELGTAVFDERTLEEKALAAIRDRNDPSLAALQADVQSKKDALKALEATPNTTTQAQIAAAQALVAATERNLAARLAAIDAAEKALKVESAATAGVRARLQLATAERDKACAVPPPATTATTPPTTTPSSPAAGGNPGPLYGGAGSFDQVGEIPAAVDTGRA